MNTKADILLRKDQVNIKEDNKDEMWSRRTTAKITMLERKMTIEEYEILKEI